MARIPRKLGVGAAPSAIKAIVSRVGANIALARTNRRWRQEDLARRAGLTRRVIIRIEHGHLGVGIGAYVAALHALGLDRGVDELGSASRDLEGQTLAAARGAQRIRPAGSLDDDF
jgi:transcriptional regulator with XRE-family HTH domain